MLSIHCKIALFFFISLFGLSAILKISQRRACALRGVSGCVHLEPRKTNVRRTGERVWYASSICYRLPQHGGYLIDVASITAFVVFPPLEHGVRSEIPAKSHASWSSEIKIELMMASFSRQGIDVILPCEDQLILGISNGRLMLKPVHKGRRDKTKKGMVSFKTMLQVAKNF